MYDKQENLQTAGLTQQENIMNESKPKWASRSFWASASVMITMAASAFKYDVGDPISLGLTISGFLGGALSMYYRIKAVKKLT